ncbi:MAG: M56 family metallopeptidase, partial [Victivallales bacterium]|nr:M56 family metallopeptidase [Victivallales bacterium]
MSAFVTKFCQFHATMLAQSAVLVICLLLLDKVIHKRARAVVRYSLWLLVLVKLVLPTSLRAPTGVSHWLPLRPELNLPADPEPTMPTEPFDAPRDAVQEEIEHVDPRVVSATAPLPAPMPPPKPDPPEAVPASPGNPPPPTEVASPTAAWANAPEPTRAGTAFPWRLGLFLGWGAGLGLLIFQLVRRYRQVGRLLAASTLVKEGGSVYNALDQCHRDLLMRRPVELRITETLISPAVCGLWRPVILMPAGLLVNISPAKLQAVFTHELCHIKRGDLWVNLLQSLLQIFYFFNPFLWLANAKIRSLREKAVDEMSLANLDGDARDYSGALVDIAELTLARPRFSLRLVGIVESKNALGDRIRHILSRPFPRSARLGLLGLVAIGALGAALLPMQRDDEPPVPLPESYEDAKGSVNHQVEIGASTSRRVSWSNTR